MLRAEAILFVNSISLQQVVQSADAELQMPRAILTNVWHRVGWWSPVIPFCIAYTFALTQTPTCPTLR